MSRNSHPREADPDAVTAAHIEEPDGLQTDSAHSNPNGAGEDLPGLLTRLDPRQRAVLTAGATGWSTLPAPEAGLPALLMGDGPLGLVSPTFDERETSLLLPCGTALGATWDPEIVHSVALAQGSEALRRGFAAVYAPNLNLARTGQSGRTFEMLSEDPLLTGVLGSAFVAGLQSQGVASCPKHLVCNDTETERQRMSVTVDEVTLREVYLRPFEMVLGAGAWMVMAAYNRLNGVPCTAHADLIAILKDEWGWDGLVVSDYFALGETLAPAHARLDLEMPGPAIHFGERLADAVAAGEVPQRHVDDAVLRLLRLARRVGALTGSGPRPSEPAGHVSAADASSVLVAAAAASFTLLRDDAEALPLRPRELRRLAMLGPNAQKPCYQGATFGRVRPAGRAVTPWEAVRERFGPFCDVVHEPGVPQTRPEPLGGYRITTPDGHPGVLLEYGRTAAGPDPVHSEVRTDSSFVWFGSIPGVGATAEAGYLRLTTVFVPESTGRHVFAAGGSGETVLTIDGEEIARRAAPAPGDIMGQVARAEMTGGEAYLTAGVPVTVVVRMDSPGARVQALTVGCLPPQPRNALERAVSAASSADVTVLVVGDTLETSRESRDLDGSALPAEQEQLIRRVAEVNPRTVVVLNAGRPVDMPWADDVAAVLYAWLPGQEFGSALASVLAGDLEPGGRLPVTVPRRDEDRSTWGERLDADLALDYTAAEPTGYRHLWRAGLPARFAFGSGMGYTRWRYGSARLAVTGNAPERRFEVKVPVTNTGPRTGRDVVQVYVRGPGEPDIRLAGFAGVRTGPGETAEVMVALEERAFARWDTASAQWSVAPGRHEILVGRSSTDLPDRMAVDL
ncbi:hypothetical protein SGFS_021770 [Streptomyces graminofaciens]|uniref:PA14 domain-containing protein n=1 Tax=Streptomyces graminofaciens TaxID=68212 RepID=A0ABM7F4Y0_9ACTN|nr:glycoside hydrolase family 3 C-terminal domain-containing protein [Streptomyces graminofaciens]BBC30883.1 hypothetical protein SGFS_021770 [Streptomyces graminofaciens]